MIKRTTVLIVIAICLVSFFLISYQFKGHLIIPKIHLCPLISPWHSMQKFFNDIFYIREENIKLKEKLYNLILQNQSQISLIEENQRLKNLLELKKNRVDVVTIAEVVARGSNKFLNTVWINKGTNDGVKENMPVITFNGLTGKVVYTTGNYSEILLITDPNFSVAVRIERTRVEGVMTGAGTNKAILKYIPHDEEVLVGDRIITSGLDNLFPEGINVGVVKKIDKKRGGFQYIEVIPYQSDIKVEEVAVIKKYHD